MRQRIEQVSPGATPDERALHFLRQSDPGGPKGACLESRYSKAQGYPMAGKPGKPGIPMKIARFMLEWFLNKPLGDLHALHTCHNRACIRPQHLYAGTAADNWRDTREAGHAHKLPPWPVGKPNPSRRKLTDGQVAEIRTLAADGVKQVRLAEQFGVSKQTICDIVRRRLYQTTLG